MPGIPRWASQALSGVYDPCCREKGISVVEMGLIRSVEVNEGLARVELLLTSGWCPTRRQLTPESEPKLPPQEFLRRWTVDDIHRMVYEESGTDMLVAMPLPLTDLYHDGLSPWQECAEPAARDPDRTIFWGTVNPLEGRKALDLMERQVGEYNARAFKLYNVRHDYGSPYPWRMDDPRVAFPIFEKACDLGVNLIGVHKGVPLGPQPIEHTQTWDMDGAAANFPCSPRSSASCSSGAAKTRSSTARRRRSSILSGRCGRFGTSRSRRASATGTATRSSPTRPNARSSVRTCYGCMALVLCTACSSPTASSPATVAEPP